MAITQVGSATNNTQANDDAISCQKPTGVASGDVLLAFITSNDQDVDAPSGWKRLDEETTGVFRNTVFYKVAGSFESSSYVFRIDENAPILATIVAWRGVDNFRPIGGVNHEADSDDSNASEPLTTPTVSGNTEEFGRVLYFRAARRSDSVPITFTESTAGVSELADIGRFSGGSVVYSHAVYADDADFEDVTASSKSGLAITASTAELNWITRTIILSAEGAPEGEVGGGDVLVFAGTANAYAVAGRPIFESDQFILTDETVPTYEIFVDWDNDGGLDFGNFELATDGWEPELSTTIVEISSDEVHLGRENSLKITWDASASQSVWKYKTLMFPGRTYKFSAWVHVNGQAVQLATDTGATSDASTTTSEWEYLECSFSATNEVHSLSIEPTSTPTNGDVVYFDQVMVTIEGEDVSARVLGVRSAIELTYGRDTNRSLSDIQPGETGLTLDNSSRDYSPDNPNSPLLGMVVPGRHIMIRATFNGQSHTLFNGYLDNYVLVPTRNERAVDVNALDVLQKLNEATISTELYESVQTGEAMHLLLDAIEWPTDKRDIDHGATTIQWWWEEGADAFEAMNKIVASEGPPAIAFVDSAGNFVFRGRHHRIQRETSRVAQATFVSGTNENISYVGTGALYSDTASGTEYILQAPVEVQPQDLLVAFVITDADGGINLPPRWTLKRTLSVNDGSDDLAVFILIKDAEAEDEGEWSGSVTASASRRMARVVAYRGTAPAASQFIVEDGDTDTAPTPATTTPTLAAFSGEAGNWRLSLFVAHDDAAGNSWGSYSLPSTERFDDQVGSSDPVLNVAFADSDGTVSPTASREVTATYSGANLDTSAAWIGLLRPYDGSGLRFEAESFEYDIGWTDLVNSVNITVEEREPTFLQNVFESEETYVIDANSTHEIIVEGQEVFYQAVAPEEGIDYTLVSGAVTTAITRTSGESTKILITATNAAVIQDLRLRAVPVVVAREIQIEVKDQTSINNHGIHSLDQDLEVAWANRYDAEAIGKRVIGLRAERLPLVTFRISNVNPERMVQMLTRDLSDRIHVVENETFTDHDFYIERIEQSIEDVGWNHNATFGCERVRQPVQNVFKFSSDGPGFDEGRLGLTGFDDPDRVFVLGESRLGQNVLGT